MEQLPPKGQQPKWLQDALDRIYWEGFAAGEEGAQRVLRAEIRDELEAELSGFDPDCDLCTARRTITDLTHELVIVKQDRVRWMTSQRGWAIREGRYRYRETR